MSWKAVLTVTAVAVIGAGVWYMQRSEAPAPAAVIPTNQAAPAQLGEIERSTVATDDLPTPAVKPPSTVGDSDDAVRAVAEHIAPPLLQWLKPTEQIRRWVALVDQMAEGSVPPNNRPLDYPVTPFKVDKHGNALRLDKANYQRAVELIDAVTAIPPEKLAAYYRAWEPLFEKAYRELGRKGSFDQRLRLALQRMNAVAPLPTEPKLERPSVYYTYADDAYEKATDVDKLMWRLGPDNAQRLQAYLRELEPLL